MEEIENAVEVTCLNYETNATPSTVREVIEDYTYSKSRPCTFFDPEMREMQCGSSRNRSIDDMLLIVKRFVPEATVKQVLDAFIESNKEKMLNKFGKSPIMIYFCNDIEKPVFMFHSDYDNFRNDLFYYQHLLSDYYIDNKTNSKHSIRELVGILDGKMVE